MARTSKLFYGLVGVLLILIAGLIYAIAQQRETLYKTRLKDQLDRDAQRIDTVAGKAQVVTAQLPLLRERATALQNRWQQVQSNRLYKPEDKAQVEGFLRQITAGSQLELLNIESSSVEDLGEFRAHVFHIRMNGNQTNLPAWTEAFFRQRRLARFDRVSVVSPDLTFQKLRLRATVRYYEPKDPAQLVPGDVALDKFEVPLTYLSGKENASDPIYGPSLQAAQQKSGALNGTKGELDEAAKLEKQIAGLEKLLAAVRALDEDVRKNRAAALQNIPTLYIRVRNSPVGSAALLLTGNDAKFPELAGDE